MTAWEALASEKKTTRNELPVVFEDVQIHQAVQGEVQTPVILQVSIDRSDRFQACTLKTLRNQFTSRHVRALDIVCAFEAAHDCVNVCALFCVRSCVCRYVARRSECMRLLKWGGRIDACIEFHV